MVDFVALAAVAERLIEENGRSVTLSRKLTRAVVSSQPWRAGTTVSVSALTGVAATGGYYIRVAGGMDVFLPGDLVSASGFTNSANNGQKHVVTVAAQYITVSETLVNETPPGGASITLLPESVTGMAVFVGSADLGYTALQEDAVRRGAEIMLFAANNDESKTLEEFDQVTDGSLVWTIVRAEVLKPASTRLLYLFEVER